MSRKKRCAKCGSKNVDVYSTQRDARDADSLGRKRGERKLQSKTRSDSDRLEVNDVKEGNGMKVMDFHGYVEPDLDIEKTHEIFDSWGIHEAVSIVDFVEDDLPSAVQQAKSSNRIHPAIMIPPQLRSAPKYLEKSVKMGFLALKIHSESHGFKYDDPVIFPTIRKAEDLGIPVLVHTEPSWSIGPFYGDASRASILPYTFREVDFVFYEGNISLVRWSLKKFDNLYIDTSNFPGFRTEEIEMLFEWGLEDQIIFGTDFHIGKDKVLSYHNHQWRILKDLKLDNATRKKILEDNWKKVFHFSE